MLLASAHCRHQKESSRRHSGRSQTMASRTPNSLADQRMWYLSLLFVLCALVDGHRNMLTRPSCDGDFGSSDSALQVPDATISWAFSHYLSCTHRAVWSKFTAPSPDFSFYVGIGIPPRERFAEVRADALIIGPGLPALTEDEMLSLPAEVRADPIWERNDGIGGLLHRSPRDQSTCSHLGEVMKKHCTLVDGRCNFYEPFGGTNSWRVLDADENVIPVEGAEYHVAVWLQDHVSSKVGIALGTWVENFWDPFEITTPSCARDMNDFSEKKALQQTSFPAAPCANVPSDDSDTHDNTVSCVAGAVCPVGAECDDFYQPKMGCGGVRCPTAVALWDDVNTEMHMGMAIKFTGDAELDFVQGMIPHHKGAVDMCQVLVEKLECDEWDNLGGLDGMVHFCNHVKKEQQREIAGLEQWLEQHGASIGAGCHDEMHMGGSGGSGGSGGGMHNSGGCGNSEAPSSGAYIEANHLMHAGMGIEFSCNHVTDFVRAMIPHHAGAIAMCEIMDEHVTESPDAYLSDLCVNITRVQRAEIAWLSKWLHERGELVIAPCGECAGGVPPAPAPELPCEDMLPTSSYCHLLGEGDSAFCTCDGVTERHACGTTDVITGFGMLNVSAQCSRHCGSCPAERPPLFYLRCPQRKGHGLHGGHSDPGASNSSRNHHGGHGTENSSNVDHSAHDASNSSIAEEQMGLADQPAISAARRVLRLSVPSSSVLFFVLVWVALRTHNFH